MEGLVVEIPEIRQVMKKFEDFHAAMLDRGGVNAGTSANDIVNAVYGATIDAETAEWLFALTKNTVHEASLLIEMVDESMERKTMFLYGTRAMYFLVLFGVFGVIAGLNWSKFSDVAAGVRASSVVDLLQNAKDALKNPAKSVPTFVLWLVGAIIVILLFSYLIGATNIGISNHVEVRNLWSQWKADFGVQVDSDQDPPTKVMDKLRRNIVDRVEREYDEDDGAAATSEMTSALNDNRDVVRSLLECAVKFGNLDRSEEELARSVAITMRALKATLSTNSLVALRNSRIARDSNVLTGEEETGQSGVARVITAVVADARGKFSADTWQQRSYAAAEACIALKFTPTSSLRSSLSRTSILSIVDTCVGAAGVTDFSNKRSISNLVYHIAASVWAVLVMLRPGQRSSPIQLACVWHEFDAGTRESVRVSLLNVSSTIDDLYKRMMLVGQATKFKRRQNALTDRRNAWTAIVLSLSVIAMVVFSTNNSDGNPSMLNKVMKYASVVMVVTLVSRIGYAYLDRIKKQNEHNERITKLNTKEIAAKARVLERSIVASGSSISESYHELWEKFVDMDDMLSNCNLLTLHVGDKPKIPVMDLALYGGMAAITIGMIAYMSMYIKPVDTVGDIRAMNRLLRAPDIDTRSPHVQAQGRRLYSKYVEGAEKRGQLFADLRERYGTAIVLVLLGSLHIALTQTGRGDEYDKILRGLYAVERACVP